MKVKQFTRLPHETLSWEDIHAREGVYALDEPTSSRFISVGAQGKASIVLFYNALSNALEIAEDSWKVRRFIKTQEEVYLYIK